MLCRIVTLASIAFVLPILTSTGAMATAQRTFVSTGGNDANACSLAAPCRGFAAAVAAVAPGGEVIVLDSGGYGTFAIAKSVSVIAPAGVYAGISVFSGSGISVSTVATDTVKLQGLTVSDQGPSGPGLLRSGIVFVGAGTLVLERLEVTGFSYAAINFQPTARSALVGSDLLVRNSSEGMIVNGGASSIGADVTLNRVHADGNGYSAITFLDNVTAVVRNSVFSRTTADGVQVGAFPLAVGIYQHVTLEDCDISGNGVAVDTLNNATGYTYVAIVRTVISNNNTGLLAGNYTETRLAASTITANASGISTAPGGIVQSQGNNFIFGNVTDGTVPTIFGSK